MRTHFIAIGGSAMHNLAIALKDKGYQVTGSDESNVTLINQFGQVVLSSTFFKQTSLNTENLPSGLYFIRLNNNTYRIVK